MPHSLPTAATLSLRARFLDKMKDGTAVTRPASPAPGVKSYTSFDLNGSYQINEKVTIRGGITNLADKQPLVVGGTAGNTNAGIYDIIGRSFFLAIKAKM